MKHTIKGGSRIHNLYSCESYRNAWAHSTHAMTIITFRIIKIK